MLICLDKFEMGWFEDEDKSIILNLLCVSPMFFEISSIDWLSGPLWRVSLDMNLRSLSILIDLLNAISPPIPHILFSFRDQLFYFIIIV